MKAIHTRFPGKCRTCGVSHSPGDTVYWDESKAIKGVLCPLCNARASTVPAAEAAAEDVAAHEREALEALDVPALRKLCAEQGLGSGVWRAGAKKAALVEALLTGKVEESSVEAPSVRNVVSSPSDGLGTILAGALVPAVVEALRDRFASAEMVAAMVAEAVKAAGIPRRLEVVSGGNPRPIKGLCHEALPLAIRAIKAGKRPLWLVGPAGTGKTTAAAQMAEALGVPFYGISCSPQTPESRIMGYQTATGETVSTLFRKAYTQGGLFCADEMDNANAQVASALNSALSNGHCPFPDAMGERHADFYFVATANTYGLGPDRTYVGRCQLDGATLDRFIQIEWPVDRAIELQVAGEDQKAWVEYVQAMRAGAENVGARVVISPRASLYGAELLRAGIDRADVEKMVLWKGTHADEVKRIKANAGVLS